MAADTAAKRYSAINIACPWRGLNVIPNIAIPQGERQAVMFMYSGILAAGGVAVSTKWTQDNHYHRTSS